MSFQRVFEEESPLVRATEKGIPPAPALVRVGMTEYLNASQRNVKGSHLG
jgi:hypothetical protein